MTESLWDRLATLSRRGPDDSDYSGGVTGGPGGDSNGGSGGTGATRKARATSTKAKTRGGAASTNNTNEAGGKNSQV
jgi:hypothetical protein